jgi:hypothetical protein
MLTNGELDSERELIKEIMRYIGVLHDIKVHIELKPFTLAA